MWAWWKLWLGNRERWIFFSAPFKGGREGVFGVNNGSGVTVTAGASAAEALVTAEVIATTILVAQETVLVAARGGVGVKDENGGVDL